MNSPKKLLALENILNLLLLFVPVAIVLEYFVHPKPIYIFAASALAIIPLAGLMGKATEHLAVKLGEGVGGLLNATFGNAAELIIAIVALRAGLHDLVKASITGSIIGNILLVFGLSAFYGGLKHQFQKFNATAASLGATLLVLSAIGLVVPALFHMVGGSASARTEGALSFEISIVLIVTYMLSLVFTLKTHRHLYVGDAGPHALAEAGVKTGGTGSALALLLAATAGIAFMSEMLVGAVEDAAETLHMNEVFVGVILVAIIGNAAEHSTAILMAGKNKMDAAIN